MYLLKYLAQCGICSRRKAAELIKQGAVTVNGEIVTMPFVQIEESDVVVYKREIVKEQKHVYILLNKPKDYLTTCADERGRKTVLDLVRDATDQRVFPIGRLDRMTTGLLLLTNDGALTQRLSHPSYKIPKKYRAQLDKPMQMKDCQKLLHGIELDDGFIKVDACFHSDGKNKRDVVIEIHSGRNRIIRRMLMALGYRVEKLERIEFAGLTLGRLARGSWRFATSRELDRLLRL